MNSVWIPVDASVTGAGVVVVGPIMARKPQDSTAAAVEIRHVARPPLSAD
jgi:hypothetical protein